MSVHERARCWALSWYCYVDDPALYTVCGYRYGYKVP